MLGCHGIECTGKGQKVASPGWACSPGEKKLEFSKKVVSLSKVMEDC